MIHIEREPEEIGGSYERCCFCRTPTPMWYMPKDVAVCPKCAAHAEPGDVPDKDEWFRRELVAMKSEGVI